MTSKHYKWQARWRVDSAAGIATHDSGFTVQWPAEAGQAVKGLNVPETLAALAVKNGPHNAPTMLLRLLKEAGLLHQQATNHAKP